MTLASDPKPFSFLRLPSAARRRRARPWLALAKRSLRVLAAVLPVEAVQKEEKRDPSCALVVIIDTSGSMGGGRVQLAKEVARLSMRRLLPHDKVGIVEFYGAKRWAAPLQPASNAIELERALNRA